MTQIELAKLLGMPTRQGDISRALSKERGSLYRACVVLDTIYHTLPERYWVHVRDEILKCWTIKELEVQAAKGRNDDV